MELALRVEEKYNVKISCSDHYPVYEQYQIGEKHCNTKKETALVESKNSILRNNLARFNRRSKRHPKSILMTKLSILMIFNKNALLSLLI